MLLLRWRKDENVGVVTRDGVSGWSRPGWTVAELHELQEVPVLAVDSDEKEAEREVGGEKVEEVGEEREKARVADVSAATGAGAGADAGAGTGAGAAVAVTVAVAVAVTVVAGGVGEETSNDGDCGIGPKGKVSESASKEKYRGCSGVRSAGLWS